MSGEYDFRPGQVLAGKYRVDRILGEGGMGVVVAAHHLQLDERVALKFLLPNALSNAEAVARFAREARAAVKIKSEHVARVTDVGQLENGAPYMVMEYLEGVDLSAWLRDRGPVPPHDAVDFVLHACEALAEAHGLGIVHRDLKPANLFRIQRADGEPLVKVLDFGISKLASTSGHDMTRTNALIGSPQYMSPEQLRSSKGVDARTDIWSLGTILFELVTGVAPFRAETITELAIVISSEPAPVLGAVRAGLPPGLDQVVARCLEKDRSARYQNVGELASALERFGSRKAHISVERVLGTLRNAGIGGGEPRVAEPSVATQSLPRTAAEWGQTSSQPAVTGSATGTVGKAAALATLAILAVLFAAGGVWFVKRPAAALPATPPRAPTESSAPVFVAVPSASNTPAASSTSAPTAPEPTSVPAATASSSPSAAPSAEPRVPPAAAHHPSHPATPTAKTVDCDPPYYINDKGSRVFKKECL